jgi:protease-4
MDPRFTARLAALIDHTYADFTARAAQARKTTPGKIDEVGQGRVWSGAQARQRGLVDSTGSFGDALKAAATRAKLGDGYRVAYIEREPGRLARLLESFSSRVAGALASSFDLPLGAAAVPPKLARDVRHELGWLAEMGERQQPFMALTHCLCTPP